MDAFQAFELDILKLPQWVQIWIDIIGISLFVSTIALLETLLSFVIAVASPEIVQRVDSFHQRRHELGIYEEEL